MKKFLSIFFISIVVLSIMASASDSVQSSVKSITGNKMYSTAVVPMPDHPDKQNNLASKEIDVE